MHVRIVKLLLVLAIGCALMLACSGGAPSTTSAAPQQPLAPAQPAEAAPAPEPVPPAAQAPPASSASSEAMAPSAAPASSAASAPPASSAPPPTAGRSAPRSAQPGATTFRDNERTVAVRTSQDQVSTFSLDTDRTSFQLALNWARARYQVDPDSVRSEEWVNAFDYRYEQPSRGDSFAIHTNIMPHPLDGDMILARIGFQTPELGDDGRPINVTLVLDSSGSMSGRNRVEIVRAAADSIRRSLGRDDRISVVHFENRVIGNRTVEN